MSDKEKAIEKIIKRRSWFHKKDIMDNLDTIWTYRENVESMLSEMYDECHENNVGNIIKSFENRMRKIFEKAVEDSEGYCKPSEPSITICLSNEGKWYCEIYSYLVNYSEEGGRHHSFYADTFEELVKRVNKAIKKQEDIWLGKEVSNHA